MVKLINQCSYNQNYLVGIFLVGIDTIGKLPMEINILLLWWIIFQNGLRLRQQNLNQLKLLPCFWIKEMDCWMMRLTFKLSFMVSSLSTYIRLLMVIWNSWQLYLETVTQLYYKLWRLWLIVLQYVIVLQTLTSVINRVAVLNKSHMLRKVNEFCLKNICLGWVLKCNLLFSQYPPYG